MPARQPLKLSQINELEGATRVRLSQGFASRSKNLASGCSRYAPRILSQTSVFVEGECVGLERVFTARRLDKEVGCEFQQGSSGWAKRLGRTSLTLPGITTASLAFLLLECFSSDYRFPAVDRVVFRHGYGDIGGLFAQVVLVDRAVFVDDECHDS
jgi:hypothetical protein